MHELKICFVIFCLCSINVEPFASWLMPKCLTSIRCSTNIIMNHFIIPAEKSKYLESINMQLRNYESGDLIETSLENGRRVLYLDINDFEKEGMSTLKFKVTMDVQVEDLKSIEYVLDIVSLPKVESRGRDNCHNNDFDGVGDDAHDSNSIPNVKGVFKSQSGCNGSRAHGKYGDKGIDLEISVPSLSSSTILSDQEIGVDIVAGWARAHEEVTLTRSLVILFKKYKSDLEL